MVDARFRRWVTVLLLDRFGVISIVLITDCIPNLLSHTHTHKDTRNMKTYFVWKQIEISFDFFSARIAVTLWIDGSFFHLLLHYMKHADDVS